MQVRFGRRARSPLTAAYPQIAAVPADAADGRVGPNPDSLLTAITAQITIVPTKGGKWSQGRELVMRRSLDRRSFLRHSCLFGGSLLTCSIPLNQSADGADRIDVPT